MSGGVLFLILWALFSLGLALIVNRVIVGLAKRQTAPPKTDLCKCGLSWFSAWDHTPSGCEPK